jgi:crotonobetainyl-CoA:carnitine CoA-transferase CaiB-like acyl-CoA transferase
VNTVEQAPADEQVQAREMIVDVAHPVYGPLREVAVPIKTAGAVTRPAPAPALGEHTDEVLRDLLRYPAGRIAALRAGGARPRPRRRGEPMTVDPDLFRAITAEADRRRLR